MKHIMIGILYLQRLNWLLGGTGYYELDDNVPLPACMIQESFQESLQMEEYNRSFCLLEPCHMHGMKGYVKNRSNPLEVNKKRYGEE